MGAGAILQEARLRAGLTHAELARRAGSTESEVAAWEVGRGSPSLETLSGLVAACGLELRVGLAEPAPDEASLVERNLRLTHTERLDQLVRTVEFICAGQAALARARG